MSVRIMTAISTLLLTLAVGSLLTLFYPEWAWSFHISTPARTIAMQFAISALLSSCIIILSGWRKHVTTNTRLMLLLTMIFSLVYIAVLTTPLPASW